MQRKRVFPIVGKLVGHLAMGACLGMVLAMSIILANIANIAEMMTHATEPMRTRLVFIGGFASIFAVGATLTGLVFEEMERN